MTITLHQIRIFWAIANGPSLTKAAKQLGLTQPSLSQQIAKLEQSIGGRLFDRVNNQLQLTDAGRFFLSRAERILAEVGEAETGLSEFLAGTRGRIGIGAVGSVARSLVPQAWRRALLDTPDLELDVHELAPSEAVEQLYGRTIQIALLSAQSVADNRISFNKIDIMREPYALAVPRKLDLSNLSDPGGRLDAASQKLLNRSIHFNFGNTASQRVEEWYRRALPRHQPVAWCRTYEVALAMVEAGLGVALVPLLTTHLSGRLLFDVNLYEVPRLERPLIALVPPQYLRVPPFAGFIEALRQTGRELRLPAVLPTPPFMLEATRDGAAA